MSLSRVKGANGGLSNSERRSYCGRVESPGIWSRPDANAECGDIANQVVSEGCILFKTRTSALVFLPPTSLRSEVQKAMASRCTAHAMPYNWTVCPITIQRHKGVLPKITRSRA